MKNHWKGSLLSTLLLFFTVSSIAQSHDWCATHTLAEQEIAEDPSKAEMYEQIWGMGQHAFHNHDHENGRGTANNPFIIPVVFHVIHDNGVGNIPYEQILSAVEVLNEDFRRMNRDTSSTRDVFKPFAVDSEIEFRLAKIDPDGNCTNGVVRINSPDFTYDANNSVKSQSFWPSNRYLNIWLVNSIENFSGGAGIVLGYAQFPGGSWNTYGIVNRNDRVGKQGVGTSVSDGRTLTHEVGHCLNLLHTFQSGCGNNCGSSGDRVCDTPPSSNSTFGCSFGQNTCSNDMNGSSSAYNTDVVDQIENYMSYDDCQNMFSGGQRDRMHAVLTGVPQLANLVSQANLNATGVLDTTERICKAEFEVEKQTVCLGESIQFTDLSYFNPTGYDWSFPGGYPETSTDTNPIITYALPGIYPVTLSVTDGTDSVTTTQTSYITVLSHEAYEAPTTESFEFASGELEENNWFTNQTGSAFGWEHNTSESYTGTSSLMMRLFGRQDGRFSIESPSYNMTGYESVDVSFKVAYAQRNTDNFDVLRVYVSDDCGSSWVLRFVRGGASMASLPVTSFPISNLAQSDWREFSFNIDKNLLSNNFRMRFEVLADGGNNIFIDDINIAGIKDDIPGLISPINGYGVASSEEKLDWKSSSPVDEYEVVIDTTSNFNSLSLRVRNQAYTDVTSNGLDTEWRPGNLEVGLQYFWRVRTVTAGIVSDWSETWSFTVSTQGPPLSISNETQQQDFLLYPNPASSEVRVLGGGDEKLNLRVYSSTGKVVAQIVNDNRIDVSQLASGMYVIEISAKNQTERKKLIVD